MKPRRKAPCSSATTNGHASVQSERKRPDVTSPGRRKSSLGESVCPPPEYCPFAYEKRCPKFSDLAKKDPDEHQMTSREFIHLQYELEALLSYSADCHLRTIGEVAFLTSGDYPTMDLENRPMPQFSLREIKEPPPILDSDDNPGICGLPVDQIIDDDIDVWPPHHIPTRFWKWCMEESLKPLDIDFLREFKRLILDSVSPEALQQLYLNEPWKHRKKPPGRTRLLSNGSSVGSTGKRRLSIGLGDRKKDVSAVKRRCVRERFLPCIANMVDVVCREMVECDEKKENGIDKVEDDAGSKGAIVKKEITDEWEAAAEPPKTLHHHHVNRVHSPRVKENFGNEAEFLGCTSSNLANGTHYPDGTPRKRNGELLHNGYHAVMNGGYVIKKELEVGEGCSGGIVDDVKTYNSIGGEILHQLISKGLIPEYSPMVFDHLMKNESECEVSMEGKEDYEEEDLDEVSEELHRCQQELKEMEPDLLGITDYVWQKLIEDFSFWETAGQLDDVDNTLFRLTVNTFREFPRRYPTPAEWPSLCAAMQRRNEKARLFYGAFYKRGPEYYEEGAPEVASPENVRL